VSTLKLATYRVGKFLGLFHLARWITRRHVRILCYHGIALGDEYRFRPKLFMRPTVLRRRFELLQRWSIPVIPLDDVPRALESTDAGRCPTVLTFDDGFHGNAVHCGALLREYGFPATIYVTTYYVLKQVPVFRLAVQYMVWKAAPHRFPLDRAGNVVEPGLDDPGLDDTEKGMWELIEHAEAELTESERQAILRRLGERLDVPYDRLLKDRNLSLMSEDEIRALLDDGVDIQLHTHRHRFPVDPNEARRELEDNRAVLEPIVGKRLHHFCYPSGVWERAHSTTLAATDVRTATTCDRGMNARGARLFELKRFLDGENVTDVEFEAEVTGFAPLLRRLLGRDRG
jgi:peptidoglycan/xylan/chitin deacetylase (PgdA/CDA1 family)